jgi:hypothetical protein
MVTQPRGASVLAAAKIYGLPHHAMRQIIREGHVMPGAVGRRSIVLFSELKAYLLSLPPTKSSRAIYNREASHA